MSDKTNITPLLRHHQGRERQAKHSPIMSDVDVLLFTIADIRAATGVGHKPMLVDLVDAIKDKMREIRNDAMEEAAKIADEKAGGHKCDDEYTIAYELAAKSVAAAIRSLKR